MNYEVIIFPSERGWKKIISDLMSGYKLTEEGAIAWAEKRKTIDNGYREQLWSIIDLHHTMFFNGTDYFKSTEMVLFDEKQEVESYYDKRIRENNEDFNKHIREN